MFDLEVNSVPRAHPGKFLFGVIEFDPPLVMLASSRGMSLFYGDVAKMEEAPNKAKEI